MNRSSVFEPCLKKLRSLRRPSSFVTFHLLTYGCKLKNTCTFPRIDINTLFVLCLDHRSSNQAACYENLYTYGSLMFSAVRKHCPHEKVLRADIGTTALLTSFSA